MLRGDIIHKDLSYKIYGLLFKVHNALGRYRKEKEYGDYFEFFLNKNNLKYKREFRVDNILGGEKYDCRNICDFVIEDKIVLEFKNDVFISKDDYLQTQRYLSALKLKLGILVNFRQKSLAPRRVINHELNQVSNS